MISPDPFTALGVRGREYCRTCNAVPVNCLKTPGERKDLSAAEEGEGEGEEREEDEDEDGDDDDDEEAGGCP